LAALRTLVDPTNPKGFAVAPPLQDAALVQQHGGPGNREVPAGDQATPKEVRDALLVVNASLPDRRRALGPRDRVDPIRHRIGTASAWGGNPDRDAIDLNVTPAKHDGHTTRRQQAADRFAALNDAGSISSGSV